MKESLFMRRLKEKKEEEQTEEKKGFPKTFKIEQEKVEKKKNLISEKDLELLKRSDMGNTISKIPEKELESYLKNVSLNYSSDEKKMISNLSQSHKSILENNLSKNNKKEDKLFLEENLEFLFKNIYFNDKGENVFYFSFDEKSQEYAFYNFELIVDLLRSIYIPQKKLGLSILYNVIEKNFSSPIFKEFKSVFSIITKVKNSEKITENENSENNEKYFFKENVNYGYVLINQFELLTLFNNTQIFHFLMDPFSVDKYDLFIFNYVVKIVFKILKLILDPIFLLYSTFDNFFELFQVVYGNLNFLDFMNKFDSLFFLIGKIIEKLKNFTLHKEIFSFDLNFYEEFIYYAKIFFFLKQKMKIEEFFFLDKKLEIIPEDLGEKNYLEYLLDNFTQVDLFMKNIYDKIMVHIKSINFSTFFKKTKFISNGIIFDKYSLVSNYKELNIKEWFEENCKIENKKLPKNENDNDIIEKENNISDKNEVNIKKINDKDINIELFTSFCDIRYILNQQKEFNGLNIPLLYFFVDRKIDDEEKINLFLELKLNHILNSKFSSKAEKEKTIYLSNTILIIENFLTRIFFSKNFSKFCYYKFFLVKSIFFDNFKIFFENENLENFQKVINLQKDLYFENKEFELDRKNNLEESIIFLSPFINEKQLKNYSLFFIAEKNILNDENFIFLQIFRLISFYSLCNDSDLFFVEEFINLASLLIEKTFSSKNVLFLLSIYFNKHENACQIFFDNYSFSSYGNLFFTLLSFLFLTRFFSEQIQEYFFKNFFLYSSIFKNITNIFNFDLDIFSLSHVSLNIKGYLLRIKNTIELPENSLLKKIIEINLK